VDDARVPELRGVLDEAAVGVPRFDLGITGLGAFPSLTRPRVIWAGVGAGGEELGTLARRVEQALARVGVPHEARPFSAHVTLARIREPRRDPDLAAMLAAGAGRAFGTVMIERVCLMRSDLSPRGARYTEVVAAGLGGR
jgi:2'-5' RNA ligase